MGGGTFHGRGFDFGPYLVEGRQGGVASMGEESPKPKVLLLTKPLELQYYFALEVTRVLISIKAAHPNCAHT